MPTAASLSALSARHAQPEPDNADAPLLDGPITTETLEDGAIVNIVKTEVRRRRLAQRSSSRSRGARFDG